MANTIIGNWRLILNSLAIVGVVAVTAIFLGGTARQGSADNSYFPPMTMVYERASSSINGVPTMEVHRLEYRSRTDWTDTVIEATGVNVRSGNFQGVVNRTGSYSRQKGTEYTEYHAITDSYHEEVLEPNTTFIPNAALGPYGLEQLEKYLDIELIPVTTDATVCYYDDCQEDAPGLLYISENGQERVFANDRRWDILLRVGESFFVVREVRIEDARP